MKKLFAAFVIAVFIAPLAAQQPSAKKPITHDVYDGWKSIQSTKVSRDGVWVAYALTPQDGDGELVVRNLKTSVEYRAARGRNPVITPDSRFVVFEKSPLKADVDKARKAKRKPDEMPKSGVGVVDCPAVRRPRSRSTSRISDFRRTRYGLSPTWPRRSLRRADVRGMDRKGRKGRKARHHPKNTSQELTW